MSDFSPLLDPPSLLATMSILLNICFLLLSYTTSAVIMIL